MEQISDNTSPSVRADESLDLAKITLSLKELQLPDEWEYVSGNTLMERFEATANVIKKNNPNGPTGQELMERYKNDSQPFVHSVWFNRPLQCDQCQNAGADGYFTIVSIKHGLYVVVTAEEMHMVTDHQGAFSSDIYTTLKIILSDINGP